MVVGVPRQSNPPPHQPPLPFAARRRGHPDPPTRDEATRGAKPVTSGASPRARTLALVPWYEWTAAGLGTAIVRWAAAVGALAWAGRGSEARALAGFIPDCIVLFRRLLADRRVPRRRKFAVVALFGYLALPFDLVPDFIPVAGQLDDALAVALVLRFLLRSGRPELLTEHWPGPPESLALVRRLAFPGAA
jgi:uncharacterized membrane protein YkvA (DUF1232 family)